MTIGNLLRSFSSKKFMIDEVSDDESSTDEIYFVIGLIAVVLIILFAIFQSIRTCRKYGQNNDFKLRHSNSQNTRRRSSIRNPSTPLRRSSLDIRTQMEIREKRQSTIQMISSINQIV